MKIGILLLLLPLTVFGQQAKQYVIQGKKYTFTLYATRSISSDSVNFTCSIDSIAITGKSAGNKLQSIICKENNFFCGDTDKPTFVAEDMNFDGEEDIRLMQFLPAAPNIPYYYWLFNPKTGMFETNTALEEITSPVFTQRSKRITSEWRGSGTESGKTTYEYRNGKPIEVEEISMDYGHKEGHILITTKKLVGGNLKVVSKKLVKEK